MRPMKPRITAVIARLCAASLPAPQSNQHIGGGAALLGDRDVLQGARHLKTPVLLIGVSFGCQRIAYPNRMAG